MKRGLWLAVLIVMLARLPFLHISFFSVDEAVSAVAANEILDGKIPYRDAIDHRGPLTYYFYAAIFSFSSQGNMWAVHLSYLLIHLSIIALVYFLARNWLNDNSQVQWAVLAYALFSSCNYFTEGLAAHTEWLLSLATVSAWLILLHIRTNISSLLAGLFIGIAICSKQVALLDAVALGLGIWITKEPTRKKLWNSLFYSVGVMVVPFTFGLIFLKANALNDLIFYVFTYNTEFYLPELGFTTRIENSIKLLGSFILQNWLTIPVVLLSFNWLFTTLVNRKLERKDIMLLAWLGLSLAAALAGGRAFGHYLIPSFVPLALWSGKVLGEYISIRQWTFTKQIFAIGLLGVLIFGPLAWLFYRHKHMLNGDPSISEYKDVSVYINKQTSREEKIFVWGFSPEIYVLSNRRPASRFTFCNPLSGHLPAANESNPDTRYAIVSGSWDSLEADFNQSVPSLIIDTQPAGFKSYHKFPMKNYPFFENYLKNYKVDSSYISLFPKDSIRIYKKIN